MIKKTIKYFSLIVLIFFIENVKSQTIKTEKKTIEHAKGIEVFNIFLENPISIKYLNDKQYFWYNSEFNLIKSTKGGAGGKLLHGDYKAYDENGNMIIDFNFQNGLEHGDKKSWDNEGKIEEISHYTYGELDYRKFKQKDSEKWIEWIGEILTEGFTLKVFSSSGILLQEKVQLKSFRQKVTNYYYNGKIKQEFTVGIADLNYGDYIDYFENGNKEFHGMFDDSGFRIGTWLWYSKDGSINSKEDYKKESNFDQNGNVKSEGSYYYNPHFESWQKHGDWYFYNSDGEIEKIITYEYGELKD